MTAEGSPGQEPDPQPIAERYLELLQAGKPPTEAELLREHPDQGGTLARRLALLRLLHRTATGSQLGSGLRSVRADAKSSGAGAAELPARIGRFRVLSLLGRGSFGAVYQAQDPELGRLVAVKVPRASLHASPEEEERFLREARSAALLRHPGIVQVYEVAEERGVPYIVSEYIEGRNLADRLAAGAPDPRESAELAARIADALHFAHQARIIHRDIKPGNILLDAAGRPHLADFGLARHDEDKVTVTVEGQVIGTPAYMSPEQASGDTRRVDARSDIYSLGAVLYELLSGQRPFRGSRAQLLHQVLHDEPRRPRAWDDRIPRDLETICLKAMAREPGRRYGTAADLAADLRRFLDGRPILARPVGRPERLWRWGRRNPVVASLTGAVAALLVAIAAVSGAMALRTARARDEANARLSRLNVATGFRLAAEGDTLGSLPWFAEAHRLDVERGDRDDIHRLRFESALRRCPTLSGIWSEPHGEGGNILACFHPDGERILIVSAGRSRIVSATDEGHAGLQLTRADALRGAFSPDGRIAITCGADGAVRFWDASTGAPAREPLRHRGSVLHAAFSEDGRLLVTASDDRTAAIWRTDSGEPACPRLQHEAPVSHASFDRAGTRVVTACVDGKSSVWDVASGTRVGEVMVHGAMINQAAFSPDGRKVATASDDHTAGVWDAATGRALFRPLRHGNFVIGVSFSTDGLRLLSAGYDGAAVVWDAETGASLVTVRHSLGLGTAVFSPDGRRVLTASFDGTARVWNAATGLPIGPPLHHGGALHMAAFGPEGRRIVTTSNDGTLRLWDLAGNDRVLGPIRLSGWVAHASFSPDGARAVVATSAGIVQIFDAASGERAGPAMRHPAAVTHASFSPDGLRLATACGDGSVTVWDAGTGSSIAAPLAHGRPVRQVVFSRDGRRLATACDDGVVQLWDAAGGQPDGPSLGHPAAASWPSFFPDGRRLLTACADGAARIWDLTTGQVVVDSMRHTRSITHAILGADGERVATASEDGTGRVWDARTGAPITPPLQHDSSCNSIELSHDGRSVVTTSYDATGRVWDARTGDPITPPLRQRGIVFHASFSPDDRLVVTAGSDATAIVWDARTGEQVTQPHLHQGPVTHAAFHPDGQRLLTAGADGVAAIWPLPFGRRSFDDEILLSHLLSGRRIDSTGGFVRFADRNLEASWGRLRAGSNRKDFLPSPEGIAAWHEREAVSCEASRSWTWVARHLTECQKLRPGDAQLHVRRGRARGWLGDFAGAAEDFAAAIELGAVEAQIFHALALARLGSGDASGYRRCGEDMLARLREASDAATANELAWHSTIIPGAAADAGAAMAAARRAVAAAPRSANFRNTLGAVRYRAGDLDGAVKELERAVELEGTGGTVLDWLFLAMAHRRLGHAQAADGFLEKGRAFAARLAQQRLDRPLLPNWSDPIEVRALLEEAEALAAGR